MAKNYFPSNLRKIRKELNISKSALAQKLKVHQSTITRWENEEMGVTIDTAIEVAEFLKIPLAKLLGKNLQIDVDELENLTNEVTKIPILGRIPAGVPIEAVEDIIGYENITLNMLKGGKRYFGLQLTGDSMEPDFVDKDVIIVEQKEDFESGQGCVVIVNGNDATFKKVIKQESNIILKPLNNKYEPIILTEKDIITKGFKVLGVTRGLKRHL